MAKRVPRTNPTQAVGYIRVSTDEQDLSVDAQRAGIERWAASQGVQVTVWGVDEDVHGDSHCASRPGLSAALERLHGAGMLVALRRDRLARDPVEIALLERYLAQQGVRVVTCDGLSDNRTPEGALLRIMVDAVAAYELASIRRRTREALAAKRARGEISGTVPYGYRLAADGRHLEPHPEEQATLAQMQTLRASGLPVRAVVRELARSGLRNRVGRCFGLAQVHALLVRAA